MITGMHALFYSTEPEALRAFIRDKLRLPAHDIGGGWLLFDAPAGDLGVHETTDSPPSGTHEVSFTTDDVVASMAELRGRGVEFLQEVEDTGWGLVTRFAMPGGVRVILYQPQYEKGG